MSERLTRIILGVLAVVALELGVWATVAPRSFYDDFPGGGRTWVAVDGPYNEHLVRDFGGLNLALMAVTVAAVWVPSRSRVRTAAAAWLLFAVPHFVYHLRHLDVYATSDKVANVMSLGLSVAAPLLLLVSSIRPAAPAPAGDARGGRS